MDATDSHRPAENRALYYPHVGIYKDIRAFLTNALIMWDKVDYIVPDANRKWQPEDPVVLEASEILLEPHEPSPTEKRKAHEEIEALVTGPYPEAFRWKPTRHDHEGWERQISCLKFLPDTVKLLTEAGAADRTEGDRVRVPYRTGLLAMAALANACATAKKVQTITDESEAYEGLYRLLGAEAQKSRSAPGPGPATIPVALSLHAIDVQHIRLEDAVRMRRKKKADVEALRHRYVKYLENYAAKFAGAKDGVEIKEIERSFRQQVQEDLQELRNELGGVNKLALGRFMVTVVPLSAGLVDQMITGQLIWGAAAGLIEAWDWRTKRVEVLRAHPTSWLHCSKPLLRRRRRA